jgi:hypothetical protein
VVDRHRAGRIIGADREDYRRASHLVSERGVTRFADIDRDRGPESLDGFPMSLMVEGESVGDAGDERIIDGTASRCGRVVQS